MFIQINALKKKKKYARFNCTYEDVLMVIVCTTALYTLKAALDKHAPLMTRTIVQRPCVAWFSQEIREMKLASTKEG